MNPASYAAFCGLCVLLAVTPGPDTFLVLRYSLRRTSTGFAAGAGASIGSIFWAALVGVGIAALLEQSAEAYRVLKILGGLYLVYLGIQAFRKSRAAHTPSLLAEPALRRAGFSAFGAGLLSCALNPKVGLFFLAVVPQFLPHDGDRFGLTMFLGVTDTVISLAYLSMLTLVAAKANAWLKRPRVTTVLERISGAVLAALGVGTIATSVVE